MKITETVKYYVTLNVLQETLWHVVKFAYKTSALNDRAAET
jgi:hypothetical protein